MPRTSRREFKDVRWTILQMDTEEGRPRARRVVETTWLRQPGREWWEVVAFDWVDGHLERTQHTSLADALADHTRMVETHRVPGHEPKEVPTSREAS